jgi:hypothetical protein
VDSARRRRRSLSRCSRLTLPLNSELQGKMVKGPGGAMDLTCSGSRVVVTMEHKDKVLSLNSNN